MEDQEMQRSTDRMLTTHAGSLPKPSDLDAMLRAQEAGRPYDAPALQQRLARAVVEVVRQEAEHGLDIISDGEQSKTSFTTYVSERLAGIETRPGTVKIPAASCGAFRNLHQTNAVAHFEGFSGTGYTDE
jgi:5-methyltetrahydropteroyltriglutamate--homocysteine methyltransferase